jgi:hypothetical protein
MSEGEPVVSTIYRSLHASPMFAGLPVYWFFGLIGGGSVIVFLLLGLVSKVAGLVVAGMVVVAWGFLSFVYAQDRVRVALTVIRFLVYISPRITSYSPGRQNLFVSAER